MGIYDQLADLDKTPPLASPTPTETAKPAEEAPTQLTVTKPAKKERIASHAAETPRVEHPVKRGHTRQRFITRVSLEVYQDQYAILKQVSLSAKLEGDNLSMSEMAREALDSYLTSKNLKP